MDYFRPIKGNDYTISVDGLVIDYKISGLSEREEFIRFLEDITFEYGCELKHWESFKMGRFHYNFTIEFRDGNSFWIGLGLNQTKTEWGRVRLEVNPNKVANHESFRRILAMLNLGGRRILTEIKRYDLAVDLPVMRQNVFLVKDSRCYSELRYSEQNRTEYLGAKSSHEGRCKLYNKTIESKLSHPLTRLEMTLGNPLQTSYNAIQWPTVYYIRDLQMTFDELKLTETERFILNAVLQGYGQLSQLGRKTRAKIEQSMSGYVQPIKISLQEFECVRTQLLDFISYPAQDLNATQVNPDSPFLLPFDLDGKGVICNE